MSVPNEPRIGLGGRWTCPDPCSGRLTEVERPDPEDAYWNKWGIYVCPSGHRWHRQWSTEQTATCWTRISDEAPMYALAGFESDFRPDFDTVRQDRLADEAWAREEARA